MSSILGSIHSHGSSPKLHQVKLSPAKRQERRNFGGCGNADWPKPFRVSSLEHEKCLGDHPFSHDIYHPLHPLAFRNESSKERQIPINSAMMAPILELVVSLLSLSALTSAHNINLKAHSRECFHEDLHKDDKMTVTFQVGDREFGGSGDLNIDFWVRLLHSKSSPFPEVHPYEAFFADNCSKFLSCENHYYALIFSQRKEE